MNAAPEFLHVPEVTRTPAGHVQVTMTTQDADVLASVLAQYDALMSMSAVELHRQVALSRDTGTRPLFPRAGYDPVVWQHTLVNLFAESVRIRGRVAETAVVDTSRVPAMRIAGSES